MTTQRRVHQQAARTSVRAFLTTVIALALTLAGVASAQAADDFRDVPESQKFRTEITWLADQQITTGYADGTFRPKDNVSREAFAAFLYRLAGRPSVSLPSKSPFTDVPKSAQFYKEIVWLSKSGITTGWADGTFRPKSKITREAIAAFLYRFEGRPSFAKPRTSPFRDMTTSSKFFTEVAWLSKSGMTTGYADGTFRPKDNVSREAIAAFLYRGNTVLGSNGTFDVGSEIRPGIYTAVIGGDRLGYGACYWERRSTNGTDIDGVIANDFVPAGRVIVEIASSDRYFHTDGCSGWTPLRASSPWATSVGDGTHAVGYHMKAGTYRASGGEGCYWAKLSDFYGDGYSIIDNEFINGRPASVTLYQGQGFESSGCGTWTRIG